MKKKLTTFMFGLLLAVGWTNGASAQKLTESNASRVLIPSFEMTQTEETEMITGHSGHRHQAPRRAVGNVTSDVTYEKSWYSAKTYTWYDSNNGSKSASYTDAVTDPRQMYWFIRSLYMNTEIPGITYEEVYNANVIYRGADFGWLISGPVTEDIVITMNRYVHIASVSVYSLDGQLITSMNASATSKTGWTINADRDYEGSYYNPTYYWYINTTSTGNWKAITISKSLLSGYNGVRIVVNARQTYSTTATRNYTFTVCYDATNGYLGEYQLLGSTYSNYTIWYTFPIEAPEENGYTVVLVKLKDSFDYVNNYPAAYTTSRDSLYNFFNTYVDELQLLTDGLRVGENTDAAGTVFAYTGMLNKFYFISKGKTYPIARQFSSSENTWYTNTNGNYVRYSDYAPFYSMFEEFSPTTTTNTEGINDFYAEMTAGNAYGVIHDCQGVNALKHFFSMTGTGGSEEKSVASLVLYIPDNRSLENSRNYEEGHQPQVGLYTIRLAAETEPAAGYSESNRQYTVNLDWSSSLNQMVNNTVSQTYIIYKVVFDEHGNRQYVPLDTVTDQTTYQYNEPQLQTSQTFTYIIMGYPTDATNNPVNQEGGIFYTYSNIDDVQIPGWFDFMVLYRERYESDFVIPEEKNYYRNYLYPTNLTPGTGMTMEQLKREWPNQTASYTLWRDNTGVAVLEVKAVGDKVYYRIQYYKDTQVTTGPNDIDFPTYQEINQNNH